MRVLLNADLGEGAPHDAELLALVDLANVCCGRHAGGPLLTRQTLRLAVAAGVAVAAHPGYPDRANFGRVETGMPLDELAAELHDQLGGFLAIARSVGATVKWLKPHGALYHRAAADAETARCLAAIANFNGLGLVGMPGGELARAARALRVEFLREGFADRRYDAAGRLVPRGEPGALIDDPAEAVEQARRLIEAGALDTLCVHGDGPAALAVARRLRELAHPGV